MGKKNAIPKKIAGFKVPKSLRKSALLDNLLKSSVGRTILADALTAGAAAAAAALVEYREEVGDTAAKGVKGGRRALAVLSHAVQDGTSAMMGVVAEAARSAGKDGRTADADKSPAARH
jgi:hypothetical protein